MRDLFDLNDKTVIIAGAGGGFGAIISEELSNRGVKLHLMDIDESRLNVVTSRLASNKLKTTVVDVRDQVKCESAFQSAHEHLGFIDGFINCVGLFEIHQAQKMSFDTFQDVLLTNTSAAFLMCKAVAEYMIPRNTGRIVNFASVSDSVSNPGYAAYASSKAALTHLTRVLAVEWARYSITVNAISPAIADTPLTHEFLETGNNKKDALSRIPMGRICQPEDILGTVVLLLSSGGSFITGQSIHVDGGRTCS